MNRIQAYLFIFFQESLRYLLGSVKEKIFLESLNKDASKRDLNYGTLAGFLPKHLPQKRDIITNKCHATQALC